MLRGELTPSGSEEARHCTGAEVGSFRKLLTYLHPLHTKIVIFGTRGVKFLPSTSALARVEEQKFRRRIHVISTLHQGIWMI